jgi:hypothetical protein
MNVEYAVAATAERAKDLLFDKAGKPKGHDHFLAVLTLNTVLRPATEKTPLGLGQELFDWDGKPYLYDQGIAYVLLEGAKNGDATADRVLCNAAAILLAETATISDSPLRKYAAERLSGDIRITEKKARGRRATDNSYRDYAIALRLMPPLLNMGFHPTRSDATKDKSGMQDSVCSIVCSALKAVGLHLSEKRIEGIYGSHSHQISQMTSTQS